MKTEEEIKQKIELIKKRKLKYFGEVYNLELESYIAALRWVLDQQEIERTSNDSIL